MGKVTCMLNRNWSWGLLGRGPGHQEALKGELDGAGRRPECVSVKYVDVTKRAHLFRKSHRRGNSIFG